MPKIDHPFIYFIVKQKSPVKQSVNRGCKLYSEWYIHEIEGKCISFPVDRFYSTVTVTSSHFCEMSCFQLAVFSSNDFWRLYFCIFWLFRS